MSTTGQEPGFLLFFLLLPVQCWIRHGWRFFHSTSNSHLGSLLIIHTELHQLNFQLSGLWQTVLIDLLDLVYIDISCLPEHRTSPPWALGVSFTAAEWYYIESRLSGSSLVDQARDLDTISCSLCRCCWFSELRGTRVLELCFHWT